MVCAALPSRQSRSGAQRDAGTSGKRRDARCRLDSTALRVAPGRPPASSRASTVFPDTLFGPLLADRTPGRDAGRGLGEKGGLVCPAPAGDAGAFSGMDRPRTLSAAGRYRRIGPAGAALLLVLLAGACTGPSVAPPQTEGQPPPDPTVQVAAAASDPSAAEAATPEGQDETLAALPTDDTAATPDAREAAADDDDPATEPPEMAPPTARVGLLLPLSGRYAAEGESLLRAAQLALFDTADERFLLLPRDTEGTAKGAERAARALLDDGVDLILGPLFAEGVSAVADHARTYGVTVVAFSTDRAAASEGVYLLGHTPRAQIRRVFAHAAASGLQEIALLVPDTRYGAAVLVEAWAAAAATGLSLTQASTYTADASDANEVVRALADYDRRAQALKDERAALARQRRCRRAPPAEAPGDARHAGRAALRCRAACRWRRPAAAGRAAAPLLRHRPRQDPRSRNRPLGRAGDARRGGAIGRLVPRAPTRRRGETSRSATAGSSARRRARSPRSPTTRPRWRRRSPAQAPRSRPRPSATAAASSARTGCSASTTRGSRSAALPSSRSRAAAGPAW